jgi:hypothetical protein
MKLQSIARNSSTDLFNLDPRSTSNSYPVLELNSGEVDFINSEDTICTLENYISKDFTKFVTVESLKSIVENFYTTQTRVSLSDTISFQNDTYTAYLQIGEDRYETTSGDLNNIGIEDRDNIVLKALELGYNTPESETSTREVKVLESSGPASNKTYSRGTLIETDFEEFNDRGDRGIDGIYKLVDEIDNFWESLRSLARSKGDVISVDLSKTLGSVAPVFGDIEYESGYNVLSATILYEALSSDGNSRVLYKESINMTAEETSASLGRSGVQLLWLKPETPYSTVKVVWDSSKVFSAKIDNIKFSKLNIND